MNGTGGAGGGDGRAGDETRAEHPAEHPDDAEPDRRLDEVDPPLAGAVIHRLFDLRQARAQGAVRAQRLAQTVVEHGPHPFHLLLAPARGELACRGHALAVIEHARPQCGDAVAAQRGIGHHRRRPRR
jgi:hypothetical protein